MKLPDTPEKINLSAIGVTFQLCAVLLSCNGVLLAQTTNTENSPSIQFNLIVPGARSLAMGGAFLARADDATAAYTNPAGLTALSRPEISIEGRSWGFNHVFTDSGRVDGIEPTGIGVDTVSGLRTGEARNRVEGISFLSFVYPASRRWRFAFYQHELANFEAAFETQGNFLSLPENRNFPARVMTNLYIVSHSVSAAVAALGDAYEPKLSLGIGLSYYDFAMDFVTQRYQAGFNARTNPGDRYGPPLYSEDNLTAKQIHRGNDADVAINVGFLWKITQSWGFGGVYRQGPDFDLNAKQERGPAAIGQYPTDELAKFHVPDTYGFGLAFTPTSSLKFSFDYDRVKYSRTTDDMVDIFSLPLVLDSDGMNEGLDPELERFNVDDADEFHVGLEYVFFLGEGSRNPLALRLGAWIDPDHRIRFEGDCENRDFADEGFLRPSAQRRQCDRFESLFQPGDDDIHYSAGFGIAELPIGAKTKFQIDVAFDHSERVDTAAISAVFRFGH